MGSAGSHVRAGPTHIIHALHHQARARLNTLFMGAMFLGGSGGSAAAAFAWAHGGWTAVSILSGGLAAGAMLVQKIGTRAVGQDA